MPLPRRRAWAVAVVATLAMSVSYMDRQALAAIATAVRSALRIDASQFGWLAASFSAAYLVAAPLAGWIIDRVGARRGLVASIVAWSCVSAAHALVPTFGVLLTLRVLLGIAEAPSFPGAAQCVRRALPASDRSAAFGLLFTGSSFGAAVAAPLALWLSGHFGWQTAFFVTALLGTLWIPLWLAVTHDPAARRVLTTVDPDAVSARVEGPSSLDQAPAEPETSRPRASLFADPAVLRAIVLVFASAPALMFVFVWLPQYFELGRGVPKSQLGWYLWLPPLMADAGMIGFGVLASRNDRRWSQPRSHVGLVIVAALLASALVLVPRAGGAWQATFLAGVASAGAGGLYTLLLADMVARIPPAYVSTAGGLTAAAQSLVYVVLNPVVGHWIDRSHSFNGPLVLLGALAIPGALAWVFWPMRSVSIAAPFAR